MIKVTDEASEWFKRELALPASGGGVRLFGKVYGKTSAHDGFSVGINRDDGIDNPVIATEKDGVTYYVDQNDAWFFDHLDLTIKYDAHTDEPVYDFTEAKA